MIKQIPRLLGPGLTKAGKFPTVLAGGEDMQEKIDELIAERAGWIYRGGPAMRPIRGLLHLMLGYDRTVELGTELENEPTAEIMARLAGGGGQAARGAHIGRGANRNPNPNRSPNPNHNPNPNPRHIGRGARGGALQGGQGAAGAGRRGLDPSSRGCRGDAGRA